MSRKNDLDDLSCLIREYENLVEELEYMSEAWEGDDPCEAACSDPGLQFEKGEELDQKFKEIQALCRQIAEGEN